MYCIPWGHEIKLNVHSIPHWPLPAVRDLTRDSRWSTYDVSVLKLSNVSFRGKCARMGNTLKIPSPIKLARLGQFPPVSQAGRLAGSVFYIYVFSLVQGERKSGGSYPDFETEINGDTGSTLDRDPSLVGSFGLCGWLLCSSFWYKRFCPALAPL